MVLLEKPFHAAICFRIGSWLLSSDSPYVMFMQNLFQAALTYAEAQMKIDDPIQNDDLAVSLRQLNALAKILKRKRIENG